MTDEIEIDTDDLERRAVHLEVVILLRVYREDQIRVVLLNQVIDHSARGFGGVIPAAKRRDDGRVAQSGELTSLCHGHHLRLTRLSCCP